MAPYGGMSPAPPGGGMTERSGVTVILLSLVTCGIYFFVWKYQTTEELKNVSGDTSINPMMDLLLSFVTCGVWAYYTDYRNAKKVHELLRARGSTRGDQSTVVLLLAIFGLYFIGMYMLQEEYNALSRSLRGQPA
jgi:hypothetical protein